MVRACMQGALVRRAWAAGAEKVRMGRNVPKRWSERSKRQGMVKVKAGAGW